ncbi:29695_t:CDS:2, partial [Racocetra persica]
PVTDNEDIDCNNVNLCDIFTQGPEREVKVASQLDHQLYAIKRRENPEAETNPNWEERNCYLQDKKCEWSRVMCEKDFDIKKEEIKTLGFYSTGFERGSEFGKLHLQG